MASKAQEQSQELAKQLWAIANDLRGSMDASKFKNYILGVIFYRYLSEKTEAYMDNLLKNDGMTYREALSNPDLAEVVKQWSIEHLGYIIEPKYLFSSLIEDIEGKKFSIEDFEKAISALTASTLGQDSEAAFDKLFDDMNLQDKDLGKEVSERTELMSLIMQKINAISFNSEDAEIDVLGTAYMILIGLFASGAGKKGGEFYTPDGPSRLLSLIAASGLERAKSVSDSCAGSGSLLLRVREALPTHEIGHYYADEKEGTTYNLCRMNLLMHGVPYKQFTTYNEDILKKDPFYEDGEPCKFTIQVNNPPYSAKNSAGDKAFENDPRFSGAGVLAPKTKADLAFLQHMVYHMDDDGRIAVLLPHGVLFRGNAEYTIRKYLIENLNVVDAVIGLAPNLFHGTGIPVVIIVCKKNRNGNSGNILFVDASKEFEKGKNQNTLTEDHIQKILKAYEDRAEMDKFAHVASLDEIRANDYNLNIPRYVDTSEEEETIDLHEMATTLKDRNGQIGDAEQSLAQMLGQLTGSEEAMTGIRELQALFGGE